VLRSAHLYLYCIIFYTAFASDFIPNVVLLCLMLQYAGICMMFGCMYTCMNMCVCVCVCCCSVSLVQATSLGGPPSLETGGAGDERQGQFQQGQQQRQRQRQRPRGQCQELSVSASVCVCACVYLSVSVTTWLCVHCSSVAVWMIKFLSMSVCLCMCLCLCVCVCRSSDDNYSNESYDWASWRSDLGGRDILSLLSFQHTHTHTHTHKHYSFPTLSSSRHVVSLCLSLCLSVSLPLSVVSCRRISFPAPAGLRPSEERGGALLAHLLAVTGGQTGQGAAGAGD
jgi:hypothetical protein